MATEPDALHANHAAHVAATYRRYEDAEDAVRKLIDRDVPVAHISLVGKNFSIHEKPLGYTTIAGVAKQGSKFGALWGGIIGLLMGFTVLFAPVGGPLLLFGPLAYALTTAVEGAIFGGLAGILIGWGLRREKAVQFERSIEQGEYLVMVSGDDDLVGRAYLILQQTSPTQLEMFSGDGETGEDEPET
jgi:outer membrane lipoprotein SlyB